MTLLKGDPDSSEDEHFRIVLAQTEIERVKFIVRSYLRTRLFKVSFAGRSHMSGSMPIDAEMLDRKVCAAYNQRRRPSDATVPDRVEPC